MALDLSNIFEKAGQYFNQQKELYGSVIYIDPKQNQSQMPAITNAPNHVPPDSPSQNVITSKEQSDTSMLFGDEAPEWTLASSLDQLYNMIHNCLECPLGSTRQNFVFGTGNPNADIMVIGEAPGSDEDEQGKPFVGKAGQLLTKILESIGLSRDEVFIGNIIKCRPPQNRKPLPTEVEKCEPYLIKQIQLINPAFILALGLTAVETLLRAKLRMGDARGKIMDYHGKKLLVTYHPAALLRNPEWKKLVWQDVKQLRRLYDEFIASK